jgi:hypothetical protein
MSGSASGAEGNMGINIAGGDLNQQKNTMAIANTGARWVTPPPPLRPIRTALA